MELCRMPFWGHCPSTVYRSTAPIRREKASVHTVSGKLYSGTARNDALMRSCFIQSVEILLLGIISFERNVLLQKKSQSWSNNRKVLDKSLVVTSKAKEGTNLLWRFECRKVFDGINLWINGINAVSIIRWRKNLMQKFRKLYLDSLTFKPPWASLLKTSLIFFMWLAISWETMKSHQGGQKTIVDDTIKQRVNQTLKSKRGVAQTHW